MKRYVQAFVCIAAVLLALFFVVEALRVPLLADPSDSLRAGDMAAAVTGVGLLLADVLLPVPSSLVMIAHGSLFGVYAGAALSLAGGVGAAAIGFGLGRGGGRLLRRFMTADERRQAEQLIARWGALALVVTRPIPILAEAVAMVAGATAMTWRQMLLATGAGLLPICVLYAVTGALASSFGNAVVAFVLAILTAALFWWAGRAWGAYVTKGRGRPD